MNMVLIINLIALGHIESLVKLLWSPYKVLTLFRANPIVLVMVNQSGNQSYTLINSTNVWWSRSLKKRREKRNVLTVLTSQEAVHAERDVVERDGWTGSRSIFCAELQPEPAGGQSCFNYLTTCERLDSF